MTPNLTPLLMAQAVPTGRDGPTVRAYFDYLYNVYLNRITQQFTIQWATFYWTVFWIALMIGSFFAATWWHKRVRAEREPYPVETYDGYISEANGPVGPFLKLFFIGMFLWAVGLTILHLIYGQIY